MGCFFPMVPRSFVNHIERNWINVFKMALNSLNFHSHNSSISILIKAVYLTRIYHNISVSSVVFDLCILCGGSARLASRQGWWEFSPSVKSSGFHQVLLELWCFLRCCPENIDPQATLLSLAVTAGPLQGTACLFVWSVEFTQRGLCLPGH